MDWGIFTITRKGRIIPRSRQRMSLPLYLYIFAAIINLILRFSWAANRIPQVRNFFKKRLNFFLILQKRVILFQVLIVSLVLNSCCHMRKVETVILCSKLCSAEKKWFSFIQLKVNLKRRMYSLKYLKFSPFFGFPIPCFLYLTFMCVFFYNFLFSKLSNLHSSHLVLMVELAEVKNHF